MEMRNAGCKYGRTRTDLCQHRFSRSGHLHVWSDQQCARIEPELAFILGRDLPARAESYTVAEIDAAIQETRLALELIGTRYSDPDAATFAEHLADGLFNQGLYLGR
jgi:2-keto-4-pentenoate hydratase